MNDDSSGTKEEAEDKSAKRIKVQDTKADVEADTAANAPQPEQNGAENAASLQEAGAAKAETSQDDNAQQKAEEEAATPAMEPEKPRNLDPSQRHKPELASQDEPKTSGPVSSIGENQEFNFDSMFDDDAGDANAGDMNFDMDLGADSFTNAMNIEQTNKPASLDSLLPGLETYANQTGDDLGMNLGMDGTGGASSNIFDLPDLGDSTFDDLLNDDSLGGGMGDSRDDMLNADSMMNMGDLDNFFN